MAKSKAQRRQEAAIRQAEWDALTPEQKLQRVKNAPGESKKQLKKLSVRSN